MLAPIGALDFSRPLWLKSKVDSIYVQRLVASGVSMWRAIAVSTFLIFIFGIAAKADSCIQCKLYGDCPLPSLTSLLNCAKENGNAHQVAKPPHIEPGGWVNTPCGRIRPSRAANSEMSRQ